MANKDIGPLTKNTVYYLVTYAWKALSSPLRAEIFCTCIQFLQLFCINFRTFLRKVNCATTLQLLAMFSVFKHAHLPCILRNWLVYQLMRTLTCRTCMWLIYTFDWKTTAQTSSIRAFDAVPSGFCPGRGRFICQQLAHIYCVLVAGRHDSWGQRQLHGREYSLYYTLVSGSRTAGADVRQ